MAWARVTMAQAFIMVLLSLSQLVSAQEEYSEASTRLAYQRDKCCQLQYQYKRIEKTFIVNNTQYECDQWVRVAHCGGECEVKTTYTPHVCYWTGSRCYHFYRNYNTEANYVCRKDGANSRMIKLDCKAKRECCEQVDEPIYSIYVTYQEPKDCVCKRYTTNIEVPCSLVDNRGYHDFYVDGNIYCRDTVYRNIPHCAGCCESSYHLLYFPNRPIRKCTCCSRVRTRTFETTVICYLNPVFLGKTTELEERGITEVTLTDENGKTISATDFKRKQGWKVKAKLEIIASCGCNHVKCAYDYYLGDVGPVVFESDVKLLSEAASARQSISKSDSVA